MEKAHKRKNILFKILKGTLISIVVLLIFMFAIPSIFNDFISQELKKGINEQLKTEFHFKESDISFFKHFPALTFSFEDIHLAGSEPFSNEPLISAKELGFGINVFKLIFSKEIEVDETYLTDSHIKIKKDRFGKNNYDVYQGADSPIEEKDSTALGLNLNLERLEIENANIIYQDEDIGITIISNGFNYRGKGGLEEGILELGSRLSIESIDVVFDNIEYLKGKKLRAESFTIYDTKNLSINLDDNTISVNTLDVNFNGTLDVFDSGLAYDFIFKTQNGNIQNVISALPPNFTEWSKKMELTGDMNATVYLKGHSGTVPDSLKKERISFKAGITDGRIAHTDAQDAVEKLFVKFNGSLENELVDFNLDSLSFKLKNELTNGKLALKGKTDSLYVKSNIQSNMDLTTLNKILDLPGYSFNGVIFSNWIADGIYQPSASKFPKTNGTIKLNNGSLKTPGHPKPIKNIDIEAVVLNDGNSYSESSLTIKKLNFSFLENNFTAKGFFKNFDQPEYQITANGTIDFTSLNQVADLPFLISNGIVTADLSLQGQLADPEGGLPQTNLPTANSGTLDIENIEIKADVLQYPMQISEGKFLFLNEKMAFSKLDLQHGTSNLEMNGFFQSYLDYALLSKGVLRGDIKLKSSHIDITEFFPKGENQPLPQKSQAEVTETKMDSTAAKETVVTGVMQVPKDLDLVFHMQVDTLTYNDLIITQLSGTLGIKNEALFLKNSDLKMVNGSAHAEGFYQPVNDQKAMFSMALDAKHLDIKKAYQTIELFKELVPAAEQASGQVSANYKLSGTLDHEMMPVLTSLEGKGVLKAQNIQFEGYKLLGNLSKESGFEQLNDAAVPEITINSAIKNNILYLEKFKFKVKPFRLKTEGQTSLDGQLNIKMRIGLPPLGIIGIPVTIKGSSDDFKIKLGRKGPDLKEMEDDNDGLSEQDIERMTMLKDSIREGMTVDDIEKMQQRIEKVNLDSLKMKSVDTLKVN